MKHQIYLNNAATSWPKAPGLGQEVAKAIKEIPLHPGRSGFAADDPLADCRVALARLLGSDENQHIVLCQHSTQALNLAYGNPYPNGLYTFKCEQVKGIECGDSYGEFVVTKA